jgi:hypothetical protein
MFNWQPSSSSSSTPRVVSSYFWIYWAFTIPLTVIVAFSWRLWWAWEKLHLDQDVLLEIENIEESASLSLRTEKGGNGREAGTSERSHKNAWQLLRKRNVKKVFAEKEI